MSATLPPLRPHPSAHQAPHFQRVEVDKSALCTNQLCQIAKLYYQGEYNEALHCINSLAFLDTQTLLLKGRILFEVKGCDAAQNLFHSVLRSDPYHVEARSLLGRTLVYSNNTRRAEEEVERSLGIDSNNLTALTVKAEILRRKEHFKEALELLDKIEDEVEQPSDFAIATRSMLYIDKGYVRKAEKELEEGLRIYPRSGILRYGRGILHKKRNEVSKANEIFSNIEQTCAYLKEKASQEIRTLPTENINSPQDFKTLMAEARSNIDQAQFNEAKLCLMEAACIKPHNKEIKEAYADVLIAQKQYHQAIRTLTRALNKEETLPLRLKRARAFFAINQYEKALEDCTEVLRQAPQNAEALYLRAASLGNQIEEESEVRATKSRDAKHLYKVIKRRNEQKTRIRTLVQPLFPSGYNPSWDEIKQLYTRIKR